MGCRTPLPGRASLLVTHSQGTGLVWEQGKGGGVTGQSSLPDAPCPLAPTHYSPSPAGSRETLPPPWDPKGIPSEPPSP